MCVHLRLLCTWVCRVVSVLCVCEHEVWVRLGKLAALCGGREMQRVAVVISTYYHIDFFFS